MAHMKYTLNCDREGDGRYLAEVPELPGVLAYGKTSDEASSKAMVLALRVLADQLDHAEIDGKVFVGFQKV